MRDWDVEEALDLALVQVNGDHLVDAGGLEEVCDEARGDRLARSGLAVLAGVAVVGDDGGELAARGALGRIGHDQGLHDQVVDVGAGHGLDKEDVVAADRLGEARVGLAVGELLGGQALELEVQDVRDPLGQLRVTGAGVELDLGVDGCGIA